MPPLLSRLFVCALCVLLAACSGSDESTEPAAADASDGGWIALFDGESLEGWTPKVKGYPAGENPGELFRVEDGILKVSFDQFDGFNELYGHLFYEQPFSHYRIRAEYRFVGEQAAGGPDWAFRNNGLMLHGQPPESMGLDQEFPRSIEVQLLGGDGENPRTTANLCTPETQVVMNGEVQTQHCISSNSDTYHGDQWVQVEVEVRGSDEIIHYVNGEEVMRYQQPQADDGTLLSGGTISIQAESHPTEFRLIEVLPLES